MTQQEYEQKKAECWHEYFSSDKQLTTIHEHEVSKDAFYIAFDRAYALGKQKVAVSQEEIRKAADSYATDAYYPAPDYGWYESDDEQMREVLENTFKAGANFSLGKQEKDADTVIQGWVARDCDGDVFLYQNEPDRNEIAWNGYMMHSLPIDSFPDLTWESEPIKCEIIIKRKKNG